jgi:hypothetical protein
VTKECRRKWTGFAVALTVTFTVCDAQQIGLSPSDGLALPYKIALMHSVRPEQKTPPTLTPLRVCSEAFVIRKQVSGTPRAYDRSNGYRYAFVSSDSWLKPLCPQPNSGETNRGPPRMDPPISC